MGAQAPGSGHPKTYCRGTRWASRDANGCRRTTWKCARCWLWRARWTRKWLRSSGGTWANTKWLRSSVWAVANTKWLWSSSGAPIATAATFGLDELLRACVPIGTHNAAMHALKPCDYKSGFIAPLVWHTLRVAPPSARARQAVYLGDRVSIGGRHRQRQQRLLHNLPSHRQLYQPNGVVSHPAKYSRHLCQSAYNLLLLDLESHVNFLLPAILNRTLSVVSKHLILDGGFTNG